MNYSQATSESGYLGSITVNDELWLVRTIRCLLELVLHRSVMLSVREIGDGEEADAEYEFWEGFEAAHIFPLSFEGHWITIQPSTRGSINSVQNGMLLDSTFTPFSTAFWYLSTQMYV